MKVYYAHSMSIYNTPQEQRDIDLLESIGFEVVNPNKEIHNQGYKDQGMQYFVELVNECDIIAFRAHPDGSIPAGVAKEIDTGKPVIELPSMVSMRVLSVDQTRQYLKEVGQR